MNETLQKFLKKLKSEINKCVKKLKDQGNIAFDSTTNHIDVILDVTISELGQIMENLREEKSVDAEMQAVYDKFYKNNHHIVDAAEEIDLFICQLSTNDASNKLKLGEVSESTNLYDFNQWTIIGSMECIIGYAKETWNCPVVFFTGSYYENAAYEDMVNALSSLQEKWGIGVINLYHNDEFNNISDEMRSIYMSDDIHPNKAGYRDWWGPEMEKQLLEFLSEQKLD